MEMHAQDNLCNRTLRFTGIKNAVLIQEKRTVTDAEINGDNYC